MASNNQMLTEEVVMVPLDQLQRHPRNPRRGDLDAIISSIRTNGFFGAVIAQKSTNHILVGNHRFEAARRLGYTEVPVIYVDVDHERALHILLADNRTSDLGDYDNEELLSLLQEIQLGEGLEGTGYSMKDMNALIKDIGENKRENSKEDPAALNPSQKYLDKWKTSRDQVWQVGRHRLMCGSSTIKENVELLLNGAKPRLMVTDPPYGVNYDPLWRDKAAADGKIVGGGARRRGTVQNDDKADWTEAWELAPSDVAYIWHSQLHHVTVVESVIRAGFEQRSTIIWSKQGFVISRGHYHWQHEPCLYAVKKGSKADWIGDRSQTTIWSIPLRDDVDMKVHGTQKPTECMARPMRNHSGDIYEPFCGSGTTMVAAERLDRSCYAMEIDPIYVAAILERLSMMGLVPVKVYDKAEGGHIEDPKPFLELEVLAQEEAEAKEEENVESNADAG